jgi:DNA/RNA endonuclease YhcR with UshA esterase domain
MRSFPNLQTLKGKRVWLSGKVVLYKGRPEVELLLPTQMKVVR